MLDSALLFFIVPVLLHHCSKGEFFSWKMDRNEIGEDNKRRRNVQESSKKNKNNESCVTSFEKNIREKNIYGKG